MQVGQPRPGDDKIFALLEKKECTPYQIAKLTGLPKQDIKPGLIRLRAQGLIEWKENRGPAKLKARWPTEDTSGFPRPWWRTNKRSWWG